MLPPVYVPSVPSARQRHLKLFAMLAVAFSFASISHAQTTIFWTGEQSNDWMEAGNWSGGALPTAATNTNINDGDVALGGAAVVRYLRMGADLDSTSSLTISTDATLSAGAAGPSSIGAAAGSASAITQNGGSFTVNHDFSFGGVTSSVQGGAGTYSLSDGTLNVTGALLLGRSAAGSSAGLFYQSGGSVTLGSLEVGALRSLGGATGRVNTALYQISDGTLTVSGSMRLGTETTNGAGMVDATTLVRGSKATINVGGNLTVNNNTRNVSTMRFEVDNGGVSKINLGGGAQANLAGILEAGFNGGMALTSESAFTLIEADADSIVNGFTQTPDANLWNLGVTDLGNGRSALQLSLNEAARLGTVSVGEAIAFDASGYGYVVLSGAGSGIPLSIHLSVEAGTGVDINDFLAYLTSHGINAALSTQSGYSIVVSVLSSGETGYYGWDLRDFNPDATISGVTVVPEPGATAAAIGLVAIALLGIRHRSRRA